MKRRIAILVLVVLPFAVFGQRRTPPEPDHRVEKNLVYGMYSGLALLMDVHHPDKPNGYGVIHIFGKGDPFFSATSFSCSHHRLVCAE